MSRPTPRPVLSVTSIVDTALGIVEKYGLGDMSMRRVATELGVAPGALYWHIKNKQSLIVQLAHRIVGQCLPLHEGAPDSAVPRPEELAASLRAGLMGVRDGAEIFALGLSLGSLRAAVLSLFQHSFVHWQGLDEQQAAVRAYTLVHFSLGAVSTEQAASQLAEIGEETPDGDAGAFYDAGVGLIVRGMPALPGNVESRSGSTQEGFN